MYEVTTSKKFAIIFDSRNFKTKVYEDSRVCLIQDQSYSIEVNDQNPTRSKWTRTNIIGILLLPLLVTKIANFPEFREHFWTKELKVKLPDFPVLNENRHHAGM